MRIEAAVACAGYGDFLEITAPSAVRSAGRVTVITAPWDRETPEVAERAGAHLLVTDAWRVNGSFNKARALNQWIDGLPAGEEDTWLLVLDADILIPENCVLPRNDLDPRCLYGVRRRMCTEEREWADYRSRRRALESFQLEAHPIVGGKLRGTLRTGNVAGLLGYFQMWNPARSAGWRRFRETPSASEYDVLFGLSYLESNRRFLEECEVLHLGPARVNWSGRRSGRWRRCQGTPAG
jgi:hypothetical protein